MDISAMSRASGDPERLPPEGRGDPGEMTALQSEQFLPLTERLARDSAWSWLDALAGMLRELELEGALHASQNGAMTKNVNEQQISPETPGQSKEQIRSLTDRYQALVRVNAAIAKTLTVVREGLAHRAAPLPAPRTLGRSLSLWQERRVKSYFLANLASRISNAQVAAVCGLSQNYFVTAFHQRTGETPHTCLTRYRVERAQRLLRGSMGIAEVAMACGFSDQSHLTRVFSRHTGLSPGEWRRERRHERFQGSEIPSSLASKFSRDLRDSSTLVVRSPKLILGRRP